MALGKRMFITKIRLSLLECNGSFTGSFFFFSLIFIRPPEKKRIPKI